MTRILFSPAAISVFAGLLMSVVVLPYGFGLDTQLFKTWFVLPLFCACLILYLRRSCISIQFDQGSVMLLIGSVAALGLNLYHGGVLLGFGFGILWLVAALGITVGRAWVRSFETPFAQAMSFFEKTLLSLAFLLVILTVPGDAFLNLLDFQVLGPFALPLTYGGFAQSNNFGSFIALVVGYSLWMRYQDLTQAPCANFLQVIKLCLFGLFSWTVFAINSRVSILAIGLMLLIWLLIGAVNRRNWIVKEVIVLGALFCAVGLIPHLAIFSSESGAVGARLLDGSSSSVRLSYWLSAVLSQVDSIWFGSGFNKFQNVYPLAYQEGAALLAGYPFISSSVALFTHNELLLIWVAGGIFGLALVGIPILWGLLCLAGVGRGLEKVMNLLPLLPLGIHCFTEFPLWQSGLHWIFLVGYVSLLGKVETKQSAVRFAFVFKNVSSVVLVVCLLILSVVSVDAARVGHLAGINEVRSEGYVGVNEYINKRAGDPELEHWAYQEGASNRFILELYDRALTENRFDIIEGAFPQLKKAVQFYNTTYGWNLLASGYASLGRKSELIGFIEYVRALDSDHAAFLNEALLKAEDIN